MTDDDTDLNDLFARARQDRTILPDDLAVRIQMDAESLRLARLDKPRPRRWRLVFEAVGGWQGFGGLAAASVAGVWIGFAAPAFLPDPANILTTQDTAYLVADIGFDTTFLESTE